MFKKSKLAIAGVVTILLVSSVIIFRLSLLRSRSLVDNKRPSELVHVAEISSSLDPNTSSGEAVSEAQADMQKDDNTQISCDPSLLTLDHLNLYFEQDIDNIISGLEMEEIWNKQDSITSSWPSYAEMRTTIIDAGMNDQELDSYSETDLLNQALLYRKEYWKSGGMLFSNSNAYTLAYKSRVLLEFLHRRSPSNLIVIDELIETILSTTTRWKQEKGQRILNNEEYGIIYSLRAQQYEQIKTELTTGRPPEWMDFVRTCDLAFLMCVSTDFDRAVEVVDWQIEHEVGAWEVYEELLNKFKAYAKRGTHLKFPIYFVEEYKRQGEYRHTRRLPSFRGPQTKNRKIIPLYQKNRIPNWIIYSGASTPKHYNKSNE